MKRIFCDNCDEQVNYSYSGVSNVGTLADGETNIQTEVNFVISGKAVVTPRKADLCRSCQQVFAHELIERIKNIKD